MSTTQNNRAGEPGSEEAGLRATLRQESCSRIAAL